MHVVFVIDGLGSGGAQRQLVELAVHLQRRGEARCSVLVYHPADFFEARLREGGVSLLRLRKRLPVDPSVAWGIRRFLADARADVVHAYLWFPSLWSLLAVRSLPAARRPVFVSSERSSMIAWSRTTALVQRFVYRRADAVTANARDVVRTIHERLGVPRERLHHIPNGIDLERWDADAREPSPLALEPGCFHLGLIGGLRGSEKGHTVLFQALERLGPERTRSWRVWCVGGFYGQRGLSEIEQAVAARGLAEVVRIVPPVRNVAALMTRLDAVVLPSLHEGFPNVVLEAMASRRPVVVTPVGEVPSLVADGVAGFHAKTGDPVTLARALDGLASLPPEERRAMGERGRAVVEERYAMARVAEAHLALYRKLLADGARASCYAGRP